MEAHADCGGEGVEASTPKMDVVEGDADGAGGDSVDAVPDSSEGRWARSFS